ncbi:MAG: response regulator [Betaproteobacteria bacterium]|nr:response regulator [Betaproteobacteria bacterium]
MAFLLRQSGRRFGFRQQLFWYIGIFAITVLLIVGATLSWVAYDEFQQAQESEYRLLEAHARNADVQITKALDKIGHSLNQIAEARLADRSLQGRTFAAEFARQRKAIPELGTLLVTDAAGRIHTATDAAIVGRDISHEPYFAAFLKPGQTSKLFMSRPDKHLLGTTAVVFTLPIVGADRQFLGVVGVTIGFRFFPGILQAINPDDSASMSVIFNHDGDLVYRRSDSEKFFGNNIVKVSSVFREHYHLGRQVTRHIGPSAHDGKTRLFLVRDVGDTGLGLILSRQLDEVLAKWQRDVIIYALIFLFTIVVAVSIVIVAVRHKKLGEDLVAAKLRAEEANLAKSKFLAAASHDLRQPIHAQGLFLSVLARTELTTHQREILAGANAAAKASSEMLNTLLDYSRIEAGVIQSQPEPFPLQPLLNKLEKEFASQAEIKKLAYRSRKTDLAVQSDPMLVELILRNLISNAIRYTRSGGLLVACRKRGDRAVLEVWDTGIGIAPAHQQDVFREFHQLGNPERDRHNGLGLGLAIAERLARTLGHALSLTSTLHRGSVFRLTLPIATAELPLERGAFEHGKIPFNVRVLVIDDDAIVRASMHLMLRGWGCECDMAESIEEALELARVRAPDLVISDYRLREQRTGLEAIVALRVLLGSRLPAMLITGDTAPDRLREAQGSGILLLHKPVTPELLHRGLVIALEELRH